MAAPLDANATVPVGVGGPLGETVAVNVTDCPTIEGFKLETIVVVVGVPAALLTTCVKLPLLPALLLSPEYVATIASLPTGSVVVVHCASLEDRAMEPQALIVAEFDVKLTVPDGDTPPLMVAVNVTACPEVEGFWLEVNAVAVAALLTTCASGELLLPV
jgi:hypothetical protein